jgi:hypothetical protein
VDAVGREATMATTDWAKAARDVAVELTRIQLASAAVSSRFAASSAGEADAYIQALAERHKPHPNPSPEPMTRKRPSR